MDRLSRGRPGRSRLRRAAAAVSGADDLLGRVAAPARGLPLRLGVAVRARRPRRGARDARLQLLLHPSPLHVHDLRSPQRHGPLRVPGLRPAHRPALRPLARAAAADRSRAARPDRPDAALPGLPRRHQPRVAARCRRGPPAAGPPVRAGGAAARARERRARAADRDARRVLPRRARRPGLPPGQLRGVSLGSRRDRHLPADSRRAPARGRPRRARPAVERADGGGLRPPARPRRRARAVPAAGPGGRGDAHERADEIHAARAARARPEDAGRRGARGHRELGGRQRRLGGLAPGGRRSSTPSTGASASSWTSCGSTPAPRGRAPRA